MNRSTRAISSLSKLLVSLAIVCVPVVGRATTVATPTFSPAAGTYTSAQSVTISDTTSGATCYYTLTVGTTGTTPTTSSPLYTSPITVSASSVLEALCTHSGDTNSAAAKAVYTLQVPTPAFSPVAGSYTSIQTVGISDSNTAAAIYYTTNGSTPTTASTVYSGPITVSVTETIKAIAAVSGDSNSAVGSSAYTIKLPTASTPTFFPVAGTYTNTQSVAISDATSGATIYYTTDGTTPTTSSTVYSGPVSVSSTETLKALAVAYNYSNSSVATAAYTLKVPTPTFSPVAGTYTSIQTVTISDTNTAATIYYTTNGTTPTTSSSLYTGAITVGATQTIEAIATASGYSNSAVGSAAYTIKLPPAATPTFSPIAGTYSSSQSVTISDATSGAAIYYTTDGTTPTTASAVYGGPVTVSATKTLKAIAVAYDYSNSAVATAVYTLMVPTPTFSPVAGTYTSTPSVSISDANSAATIYYTTDGSIPTTSSNVYSGPITIGSTETLKAIGAISGYTTSAIASAVYTIQVPPPSFSPAAGTYTSIQTVSISDTNTAATIYYTTNGTTPTTASNVYSSAITVSATETIKAIAVVSGDSNSAASSATYTIKLPAAATPTFSPAAGTYASTQTVTISDATSGATIYYTTDGTTPTTASAVYSGSITVSATEALKAIAASYDYSNSAVATAAYTLKAPAPTFSPAAGSFGNSQTVVISDANVAATIYYTVTSGTTGTAPTTASQLYIGPITVNSTETLEAIAVVAGYTNSTASSATYTLVTPTPTFSPAAGTYTSIQTVSISDSNSAATIYYTTNGTTPTTSSTQYSGPITVSATETIKAIASVSGDSNSAVGSAAYTIKLPAAATPAFSPATGTYTSVQTVSITDTTSGATIYYTTNGSTPTTASTVYTGPITVSATETLKAVAAAYDYSTSAVGSAAYTLKLPSAATPTFSPAAGTYTNSQSVTIADATGGATIYYTTNGSTPTTSSSVYSGPITVSSTETLEAIATATGYSQSAVGSAVYTITPPTSTPSFSPTAGTYTSVQTVTITDATSGATIYYTTNGSTPTTSSNTYSGPITVSSSETIAAIAAATGHSNSSVASAAYVISPPAATPTFSLAAGTYTSTQTVTIADSTVGATIYYTTNGNIPTTSSSVYSGPITVGSTETVEAMAIATGYAQSAVATAAYTITPPAATPVFNPVAGAYSVNQTVTITDATSGSTIYYTTNGSTPTTSSSVYSGPITVSATETITAIATAVGYTQSAAGTATYTIMPPAATPVFNPVAGAYSVSQTVSITDATSGATIYYTTNGTTPTTSSTVYSGPILVSSTETLEAIATATGYSPSAVATAAYMLGAPVATPVFSPAAGSYNSAQTVTITDATPGATIYYTTNGTTPTTSSSVYTGSITVASTETIQAYAVATSFTPSAVGSAAYTIIYPPVITGLTPSSGFPGTFVRITGTNFGSYVAGTSSVTFNGVTAQILSWTPTAIQTVAPSAMDYVNSPSVTTGPVIVNAANPPSTSTLASNAAQFTVPTAPSITGVNPVSGPIGTSVTISGFNFGTSQAAGTVTFNGVAATPTSWGADSIIVPVPTGATTGPVVVSVSGVASNNYVYTVSAGISSIVPTQGSVGTVVTISGLGFGASQGASVVSFNGVAATPSSWSDTAIVVPVPNGATTGTIAVLVNGVSTTGPVFTLVPSITSLSPSVGPVASTVTISGSNFGPVQGSSTVAFGQVPAVPTQWSQNKIVVPVPVGAVTSSVVVTVAGQASNAMPFTVGASVTATITGVVTSASGGTPLNGASIQVLQSNASIGSATSVANGVYTISGLPVGTYDLLVSATGFGSTVVSGINLSSSGSTTVNVSLGTPGTIAGSVTQSDGVTPISGATVIVAEGSDTVSTAVTNASGAYSISTLGVASYSLQVSASGYGTQNQTGVSVTAGQTTTANFSLSGQSTITYTYDEVGRLVGVTDSIKGSAIYTYDAVGNILSISRVSAGQLAILDFTPKSGLWGSTVTISGTSFGSSAQQDAVTIGGVAATITSATSNQIVVTVPANAITGPITVTAPSGTAESSTSFTVDALTSLPLITSFQPNMANIGGTVTLTGSGFDLLANDRVKFNGVVATVTSALPSILTTTVPAGADSGPISLATSVGISTSNQDFFVVPTAYTPSQVDFTGRMAVGGSFYGTINTGGDIGIVLFNAASGQMINLQVVGSTIANANITILNPDGSVLVQSAIESGNTTISPLPAPATGTYTILVESSGASSTGSLILGLFSQSQPSITPGTAQTVTVNTPGQSALYMFVGTAGQMASVQLSNSTFVCCGTVSILSPDGTTLGSSYMYGTTVSLNPVALPATGIYTVVIAPKSTGTGSANLTLLLFNEQTGATITPGTPTAITISTPGQTDSLTFSGTAGQMATVQLSNSTFGCCVTISVVSPDGTTLVSSNTGGTSPIALPATGTYTVVITTSNGATGSATLNVSLFNEQTGGTIAPGTPAAITISVPGQTDSLTFTGTAGQLASLQISNSTFSGYNAVSVSLISPDGTTLGSSNNGWYNSSWFQNPVTLPISGTYTILIAPSNGATGSASVNVTLFSQQAPAAITAGTPATVTINTPGQYASLTFTGTAGQLASVLVSNSTFPGCSSVNVSLVSPDGTTLGSSNNGCSNTWFQNPVTLPISGTYTILIAPSGGGTGSASVNLWLFNQQAPGAITAGTPATVTVDTPGESASLTFTGTAGQLATLQVSNSTFPGCWSVSLSLVSPDGTTLGSSNNGCSSSWIQNPVTLPISGTYTILIAPSGGATGTASVNLWLVNEQAPAPITAGTPATVTIDTPGQSASLTFSGTAGQLESIELSNYQFGYPFSGCWTVSVSLVDPDGTTLGSSNTTLGLIGTNCNNWWFQNPVTLPISGTYTILIAPSDGATGSMDVNLMLFNEQAPVAITSGTPAPVSISMPGQYASLTFAGTAGQLASVELNSSTFECWTTSVSILSPDGNSLTSSNTCGDTFLNPITLPISGTYTIVVAPSNANTGNATVNLWLFNKQPPVAITSGTAAPVSINTPGQYASLTFTGTAGQLASLQISNSTFPGCWSVNVSLVSPDGTTLGSSGNGCSSSWFQNPVTLPISGTYTILIMPSNGGTGSASVNLWLFNQQAPAAIVSGTPATVTVDTPGESASLTFTGTAGQLASLQISNSTFPGCWSVNVSLVSPDGSTLGSSGNGCSSSWFQNPVTLPISGTYTILITPSGGGTGTASVNLWLFNQQAPAPITAGTPATVTINTPGQSASLTFTGTAGQLASLQISNSTFPGCWSVNVSLVSPDGSTLGSSGNGCSSSWFQNPVTLPISGTYTILIMPSNGGTGSASVNLWLFNQQTPVTITAGTPATMTVDTPGESASLTFTGTAGQLASLQISNSTFPGCWSVNVSLVSPDGTTLGSSGNGCSSSWLLNPVMLPISGTYTILITPSSGGTGSASVNLWLFNRQTPVTIASGTPATVTVNTPGDAASLTFTGTVGQLASVQFTNSTFGCCVTVSILSPDGTTLISNNTGDSSLSLNPIALPAAGTYTVVIAPYNGATGSASVTAWVFNELTGTAITPGTPTAVSINNPGQTDSLTFTGTAGQYASVEFSNSTFGCCVTVSILSPDGSSLISGNTSGSLSLNPIELPATGTYTVLISPYNGATGSASVTAWVFNELIGSSLTPGTPTAVVINNPGQTTSLAFSGTAGQYASVLYSDSTFGCCVTVSILNPDGTTLITENTGNTSLFLSSVALPATGTYSVLIAPYNGTTGGANITVWTFDQQTGTTITSGAPTAVAINTPGQTASLTFNGTAGQSASIMLNNSTFNCWTTFVSILSPDGTTLASSNSCGNLFLNPITLPASGTYTIVITPTQGVTGSASITLWLFSNLAPAVVTPDTPATVTINTPGQAASLTFSGTAGQLASVQLTNSTFACWTTSVSILSPDGATLASSNSCGNLVLNTITLPVSGTYTIVISPSSGATGSATVSLSLTTLTAITPGNAATVTVTNAGQVVQETFNGVVGQSASVQISSYNFNVDCSNVTVSLLNPNGSTLASGNACGAVFASPVALPVNGIYILQIAPQDNGTGSASVTISLTTALSGTITSGAPTTVSIDTAGQVDSLTFTGTAGQYASVQLSNYNFSGWCCSGLNVSILNPDGTTLVSSTLNPGTMLQNPAVLPATGTYTLVIAPQNGITGSVSVTLSLFSEQSGTTITPGTPATVAINIPGQTDSLTFTATAGQYASVQLSNYNYTGWCCSGLSVSIVNPDGTTLVITNMNPGTMAENPVVLPATGTYTLVIAPQNGITGSVNVSLSVFNEETGTNLTSGIPTAVAINNPGQTDSLTFSGTAGQYASVLFSNSTFGCCVTVSILSPDGSTLISNNTGGSSLSLNPIALPATGIYTVLVAPYNGATGSASVTAWVFNELTGASLTPGTAAPVAINNPGQTDSLTFSGTAGQYASVLFSNSTFGCCVTVSIVNPDGTTLISNNTGGSSLALSPIALPATGTYTVLIAPYNGATGSASVTAWVFDELAGTTITPGTPTAVAINNQGQTDSLTFSGTAGQYASVLFSNSTFGCCVTVSILNPDGSTLISNNTGSSSMVLNPVALPVTGTYTLLIAPNNGATGNASVTAWVFNEQTGTTLTSGTPTAVTINTPGQTALLSFSGAAGQYVSTLFSNSSFGCCVTVSVLNPDGSTLISNNTSGSLLLNPVALPVTGTYTVLIAPYNGATGSASVTIWEFSEQAGATLTSGTPASVTINTPGQTSSLTFSGSVGQYASVLFDSSTYGCCVTISILNPDGTTLISNNTGGSTLLSPVALPATGTYTVVIAPYNGATGSANVTAWVFNEQSGATIAPNTPTAVAINTPGQTASLTFNGTAGQYASVLLSNSTYGCCVTVSILNPDGTTLISNNTGGSLLLNPVALPVTGTYTLVVAPYNGATGSASLNLWLFSELTGTTITSGTPALVTINNPGQTDSLTFTGTIGQYASVLFDNSSFGCCVTVSILKPDGSTLISNDTGGSLVLDPVVLPATGTYTVLIAPYNGATGSASVTAWTFNEQTGSTITPSTPTSVAINIPGQTDSLTFNGTAGQFVSALVNSSTFGCCVTVSILNPDGTTLISNNTGGSSLALSPVALPVTGTYTLVIAPSNGATGKASVTFWLFNEQTGTTITPGTPTAVAINTPGQTDSLTFSGTAGQYASVLFANSTFGCCATISILSPDGSTLSSINTGSTSQFLNPAILPATGTYTIVIAPNNDATGIASITLWLFNEQTGATITPATPTTVTISTPGQTDSLTFNGTAGQYASALLSNSTFGCCVTVSILNPDGSTLISNYAYGSSLALNPVALPATGTYTLVIAPSNGNTGSASVTLWVFNEQTGGTIASGTPTTVAISIPGQTDSMTFSGTAGQYASVLLSNSTFSCCATVSILNPDGSTLISGNAYGSSLALNPVALPATGTYTVVIAPSNGSTGSASVTLWLFNEQTGGTITSGTPTAVIINTPGQTDSLTFNGTAGQYASVLLTNSTFGCCVALSILNPDGTTLISGNGSGLSVALNSAMLPATGTYTLVIAPSNGATGGATITLWFFNELTGGTISSGTPTAVAISIPGQTESMTFSGTAGQYASLELSGSTFACCVTVSILNPDGTTLVTNNTGGTTLSLGPVALPATGTYTLVIAPNSGATGTATASLWVFSELTGSITPGTPTAVTINIPGQTDSLTFNGGAGQVASVQISNSTFGYYPMVSILNPDSTTLTSTYAYGSSVVIGPFTLPASGTYTLVIGSSNGYLVAGSASVTLLLNNETSQSVTAPITPATPTMVSISNPGQIDNFTFSGTTGQFVSMELTNATFGCCVSASILNPDGSTLISNYTGGTSLALGPVELSATGTYTLVIAPYSGSLITGNASVTLWLFSEQAGTVITPGTSTPVAINTPGQSDTMTFSGTAGQYASVQLANSTFACCVAVSILNPDGSTLISNNTAGSSLSLGSIALPATGTYTLVIAPYNDNLITGTAQVTLWLFSAPTSAAITPGTPTAVAISIPGQSDSLTFTGTAGQYASLQLSNSSFGCCASVSILNPDGSTLISNYTGSASLALGPVALPQTGTYSLVIAPYSGSLITGSASVTLWLFSEQTGTTILPGTSMPIAINIPGQSVSMTFSGNAGQNASVQLSNSTFGCCAVVSILNPDGSTLISNNASGASLTLGPNALPETGTYTLLIAPYSGYLITGSANVTLNLQ